MKLSLRNLATTSGSPVASCRFTAEPPRPERLGRRRLRGRCLHHVHRADGHHAATGHREGRTDAQRSARADRPGWNGGVPGGGGDGDVGGKKWLDQLRKDSPTGGDRGMPKRDGRHRCFDSVDGRLQNGAAVFAGHRFLVLPGSFVLGCLAMATNGYHGFRIPILRM